MGEGVLGARTFAAKCNKVFFMIALIEVYAGV
jgi:hypothetical protein